MDKHPDPEKSQQKNMSLVESEKNLFKEKDIRGTSVAPVTPIRMKPSTMNWLMNRGFAAVAPRVLRPLTLRPPTPLPLEQQSLGPQPQSLESGPLVTRPLVSSLPQEPRPLKLLLPNVPLNMDMNSAAMPNFPIYNYMPALIDENHFRRRRQIHTNVTNSTWTPSESLLSTVNNPQPGMEITNITYMDPTGGSMIVTRRGQDGGLDVRMVYSREFIIAASASPLALLPPANFRNMVLNMMEIIPKFPTSYYNNISRDSI